MYTTNIANLERPYCICIHLVVRVMSIQMQFLFTRFPLSKGSEKGFDQVTEQIKHTSL